MKNKIDVVNEKKRAEIFLKRKTTIHLIKENDIFHNGLLLEVGADFLILKDRLDGREVLVMFRELKKPIEIYKEVEK